MNEGDARVISRVVWHQTRPRNALLNFSDPSDFDGRYHRSGQARAWYASASERGAWAELFRHWGEDEVSPFEVRRRVGRARVQDLRVLDLTDPEVRERLDVAEDDVVGDDWSVCQSLADRARELGFYGVLTPSAALPREVTLVVFTHAMHNVTAEHSGVQRPPIRMVDVLHRIRLPEHCRRRRRTAVRGPAAPRTSAREAMRCV